MQTILKTSFLTLALCVATAAVGQAPAPAPDQSQATAPHKQPNPVHQTKELSRKLGLSPDQSSQVEPLLADRDQKVQALGANTTLDPRSMRQQRRAIMMDADQKLNAILTPDQQKQYAALKQQRKDHGAPPAAPPFS